MTWLQLLMAVRPLKVKLQRKRTLRLIITSTGAGLNNVYKNLDNDSIYHVP